MALQSLSANVLLPDGSPCRHGDVQPRDTVLCDVAWTLSQPELELGESLVQVSIQGNDTGSTASGLASTSYTATAFLQVPQSPCMTVTVEQAEPVRAIQAGERVHHTSVASSQMLVFALMSLHSV